MKLAAIGTILLLTFAASGPIPAQTGKFSHTRQLALPAAGIDQLIVECGAGSLYITNAEWQDTIKVYAEVEGENISQSEQQGFVEKNALLSLERAGRRAILKSELKRSMRPPEDARINLTIDIPQEIGVYVNDSSGPIHLQHISGPVEITDDSGPITLEKVVGSIRVADGSGQIIMEDIKGRVEVIDGSGSIEISRVSGAVRVTDGSGLISIQYVEGNLTVTDKSGRIDINDITGNVLIFEPGTGELNIERINGKVTIQN